MARLITPVVLVVLPGSRKAYGCVNIDNDDDKKDCPIKKVDRKGSRYVEYKAIKDEAGKIHLRNDLEKLPDDRGFKEFEGMPVESFAATLLKGCGWNGVVGTKKKDRPIKLDRKGLGYAEYEAQMINAVKEGEANKVVIRRKRSREEEDLWLVSGIRVRFVSQELKDGSLFFREGVVFDVVGLTGMCDVEMDDTREVIRGVQPEFLENVLPRVGGWVVVLLAKDDLRNAYEKCNDISQESRALIDGFFKEGSAKDYELNLSIITCIEPSSSTPNPVRIIPCPAGVVQRAKLLKESVFILDSNGALMSTQEYMQKVVVDVGKLEQVVAIVKSCSPNALGDLNVTMKDLSGTIPGTVHHKVIGEGGYAKDITVGAAMILANVSIFTSKPLEHYLNITMRNVVKVFRKDTVSLV
ncbi:hypothetical protein Tco_1114086 [Tanacetum coccineum]|uniref:Uncharacterized protein n=1 Tax=Tanacetum coccineum TaxID=301880 RepID=A0ABQ5IWP8_9ASTR